MDHTTNLNVAGHADAQVLVITDAPGDKIFEAGKVMPDGAMNLFATQAQMCGLTREQFLFINPCPPIPDTVSGSDSREAAFLKDYTAELNEFCNQLQNVRLMICLGPIAARQGLQAAVKITRVRGQIHKTQHRPYPVLPLFSPAHVLRRPENNEIFETDFKVVGLLNDHGWDFDCLNQITQKMTYEWCTDLAGTGLLEKPPRSLVIDMESKGGRWYEGGTPITVQLTYKKGHALVCPVDPTYYPGLTWRGRAKLIGQIKSLAENPRVCCAGHFLNTDRHMLKKIGITIANFYTDSMQLAFVVDENMLSKSLDDCTRRWIPDMAGYADKFNQKFDKAHMELVPHDQMLPYGGGDTDATFRLCTKLTGLAKEDPKNYKCFRSIQMPAIRSFFEMENTGLQVDLTALEELGTVVREDTEIKHSNLMQEVPDSIKRRHVAEGKALSLSRDELVRDILFTDEGFNLVPTVFTKTTAKLAPDQRLPSVSTKQHLPFFDDNDWVQDFIEWKKQSKLLSTYIGQKGGALLPKKRVSAPDKFTEEKGFWQYLGPDGRIHPSFFLHRTVTGRTASAYPNAQNFPKRGKLAKAFRKVFIPTEGWVFIEADLSQAELRISAWMAHEPTMIAIYRASGGDIHTTTACVVMGITLEQFRRLPIDEQKLKRFYAKAVNFGFIYGMGWRKFMRYAKTEYGINFTEDEAQTIRRKFFQKYNKLSAWHDSMREFVNQHGYVRSLHGALRRLPNIFSPDEAIRGECQRQAINSPVQRFASDLGLMGLIRFDRDCDHRIMRPVMFIHDAVVIEARAEHAQEAAAALKFYMQSQPLEQWFNLHSPVPIISDVSIGEVNLGEMEEQPDVEAWEPDWFDAQADEQHIHVTA